MQKIDKAKRRDRKRFKKIYGMKIHAKTLGQQYITSILNRKKEGINETKTNKA